MKRIERRQGYLFVEWDGPYESVEEGLALMQEVGQICRSENFTKVLVDLSMMVRDIGLIEGFRIGSAGATIFRGVAKVAVVNGQSRLARFIENVGVNRGASVSMFSIIPEAERWLKVGEYEEPDS